MRNQIKHEIKQKIKKSIPDDELTTFTLSKVEYENLEWIEKKEFRLNGNMYDVVKKTIHINGTIILHVINDKKEKELFVNLEKQIQQNDKNSAAGKNLQKLFKLFSCIDAPISELAILVRDNSILLSERYQACLLSFSREVPSPPPKRA
ncbi:MAG: hypothetical protein J0M08_11870 [Bacteroidetes bacterium]|nr:hypothetical protein [Bacteroidota bacterium]